MTFDEAVKEINFMKGLSWGWDGEMAPPPDRESLLGALQFLISASMGRIDVLSVEACRGCGGIKLTYGAPVVRAIVTIVNHQDFVRVVFVADDPCGYARFTLTDRNVHQYIRLVDDIKRSINPTIQPLGAQDALVQDERRYRGGAAGPTVGGAGQADPAGSCGAAVP